jgi:uncharacterized protein (TIGR02145 family)
MFFNNNQFRLLLAATVIGSAFADEPEWDKRIPAGYSIVNEMRGDLNGDGAEDYVLIIRSTDKNTSHRGIMIFFKNGKDYKLVLENLNCFPSREKQKFSFGIKSGNLYINYEIYTQHTMRSTYEFRYRNSDFELIGYDYSDKSNARSINFPAKKMLNKVQGKEAWTQLAIKEPILLRKIVDFDNYGYWAINNYIKEIGKPANTFTDTRDGKTYWTVKIGKQTWMAENLNYEPQTGNSWCYGNNALICGRYGRLYDRGAAKKACPDGWHLPSRDEWDSLAQAVGGRGERSEDGTISWRGASLTLRAKRGWNEDVGVDGFGFSAMPGGRLFNNTAFIKAGSESHWWTATDNKNDCTYYRYMFGVLDWMYEGCYGEHEGFSVRCVQDAK